MKKKKKWIVAGAVGLALVVLVVQLMRPTPEVVMPLSTTAVQRMDLRNTVDVTGKVESVQMVEVYSNLSFPVTEIPVEVGDKVEAGDLLCRLDSSSLESDIAMKQASISSQSQSAALTLQQAQEDLQYARTDGDDTLEDDIIEAEESVEAAERRYRQAQLSSNLARDSLDEARRTNRNSDDDDIYSRADINSYRNQLNSALIAEEDALAELDAARDRLARIQDRALDLHSYEQRIASAQLGTDFTAEYIALQQLQRDLVDCTISAPIEGTVTAIYASVGASGSGLLFVIENIEDLKVVTTVREYDINTVSVGDPVIIKSDGASGDEYEGLLMKIAPTSTKGSVNNTTGEKTSSNDGEFEAEVRVVSRDTRLLIGMTARLNIIVEEKLDALAVPYDVLTYNMDGDTVVYVAELQDDGTCIAREVSVTPGMETDFYSEVTGAGIEEGVVIISDNLGLEDGMEVLVDVYYDPEQEL